MRASTVAAILAFTSGMTVNAAPVNVGEAISGAFEDFGKQAGDAIKKGAESTKDAVVDAVTVETPAEEVAKRAPQVDDAQCTSLGLIQSRPSRNGKRDPQELPGVDLLGQPQVVDDGTTPEQAACILRGFRFPSQINSKREAQSIIPDDAECTSLGMIQTRPSKRDPQEPADVFGQPQVIPSNLSPQERLCIRRGFRRPEQITTKRDAQGTDPLGMPLVTGEVDPNEVRRIFGDNDERRSQNSKREPQRDFDVREGGRALGICQAGIDSPCNNAQPPSEQFDLSQITPLTDEEVQAAGLPQKRDPQAGICMVGVDSPCNGPLSDADPTNDHLAETAPQRNRRVRIAQRALETRDGAAEFQKREAQRGSSPRIPEDNDITIQPVFMDTFTENAKRDAQPQPQRLRRPLPSTPPSDEGAAGGVCAVGFGGPCNGNEPIDNGLLQARGGVLRAFVA